MMALLEGLNRIDYMFIAILTICGLAGLLRGGMREIVSVLSWIAGIVVALTFSQSVAGLFSGSASFVHMTQSTSQTIGADASTQASLFAVSVSFIILFAATVLIGSLIGRVLTGALNVGGLSTINSLVGLGMGLGKGWLFSVVVMFFAQLTPVAASDNWQQSKMVDAFRPGVDMLTTFVGPQFENFKKQTGGENDGAPVSSL